MDKAEKKKNIVKLVMLRNNVISEAKAWKRVFCYQDGTHGVKNDEAMSLAQDRLYMAVEKLESL